MEERDPQKETAPVIMIVERRTEAVGTEFRGCHEDTQEQVCQGFQKVDDWRFRRCLSGSGGQAGRPRPGPVSQLSQLILHPADVTI